MCDCPSLSRVSVCTYVLNQPDLSQNQFCLVFSICFHGQKHQSIQLRPLKDQVQDRILCWCFPKDTITILIQWRIQNPSSGSNRDFLWCLILGRAVENTVVCVYHHAFILVDILVLLARVLLLLHVIGVFVDISEAYWSMDGRAAWTLTSALVGVTYVLTVRSCSSSLKVKKPS